MSKAAADRAPISNHAMRDQAHRRGQERANARDKVRIFDRSLAREGLDGNAAITLVDPIQATDAVDVDQMSGTREAEVQEGFERLAAGQHLRVLQ